MKLSSADNAMSINKVKLTCGEIFDNIQTISYIKENIITGKYTFYNGIDYVKVIMFYATDIIFICLMTCVDNSPSWALLRYAPEAEWISLIWGIL